MTHPLPPLISSHRLEGIDPGLLGGKGAQLAGLTLQGFPVPPWICLPTSASAALFDPIAAEAHALLAAVDLKTRSTVRSASEQLQGRLRTAGLPAPLRAELLEAFDRTFAQGARVAVRSSAQGEDSAKDSFAGQLDTFLHVTREGLLDRVIDCLASAYSERAIIYRKLRGLEGVTVRSAVVIQLMVDSRAAGILFTANPLTRDLGEAVVSAGLGLGEGVVGGTVESDTWFVRLDTGRVREQVVVPKRSRLVFDQARGTGTRHETIDAPEPALSAPQLEALLSLGKRVHANAGIPQDIEWAIDAQGELALLQTRPITTLEQGRESIFDNANIAENYPGLILPLTFSWVRWSYEVTFREASRRFGVPEEKLAAERSVHESMVGLLDGRLYYNIQNWYRLFEQIPGLDWSLDAWEKALGLQRRLKSQRPVGKLELLASRARLGARIARLMTGHTARAQKFLDRFAALEAELTRIDLTQQDLHGLLDLLDRLANELCAPFAVSVMNDFFTQQSYEGLAKLIARHGLGDPSELRNQLLCGEKGVESVAPVHSAVRLAGMIRGEPRALALFESQRSELEVWEALRVDPALSVLRAAVDEHIARFLNRLPEELKLEKPMLDENPGFLIASLRNFLRGGQQIQQMEAREAELRRKGEATVEAGLQGKPLQRAIFQLVLGRARSGVKWRENLRLARTRAHGVAKKIYRELGRRFAGSGLIEAPGDLHYLTLEELVGTVRGTAVSTDLRALIALRKREYEEHARKAARPGRVATHGAVTAALAASIPSTPAADTAGAGAEVLRGIGCGAGRVRARAKVVTDPQAEREIKGEILVAPTTDPGWVFLMVAAGGLISERGSLLSHTAIIGRELGIPTVVGVANATELIASGEELELDGSAGTVRRISRP
jgi:phosphohistidine swiveling domain-containing protein